MVRIMAAVFLFLASVPARANQVIPSPYLRAALHIVAAESTTGRSSLPQAQFTSLSRVRTLDSDAGLGADLADPFSRSLRPLRTERQEPSRWSDAQVSLLDDEVNVSCPVCALDGIGASNPSESNLITPLPSSAGATPFIPVIRISPSEEIPAPKVQWESLFQASTRYLAVMHSFRLATEAGTRDGLHGNIFGGYFKALGAMHGWSDGDGYFENYLGHPIQGLASAYIWIKNDPRYRHVEFGKDPDYWKSRLRAYAFSWAYSEQFEIGPISEASIGQIQRYCCQYGFVDHVITPNGGLVWLVVEDIMDKYVVRRIEDRTRNVGVRIAARLALNPLESFANFMTWQYPWNRENRAAPSHYSGSLHAAPVRDEDQIGEFELPTVPRFEIAATVPSLMNIGDLSCLGGGGVAGMRLNDRWQWTLEVSGCTLARSLPQNWSGDSLTFTTGPQWIRHTDSRWTPHAHVRVGGQKITEQKSDPEKRKLIQKQLPPGDDLNPYYDQFTTNYESTGLSLSIGGGVDFRLHPGMALRLANLDYVRSWLGDVNQTNFNRGFRFAAGVVLRLGTW